MASEIKDPKKIYHELDVHFWPFFQRMKDYKSNYIDGNDKIMEKIFEKFLVEERIPFEDLPNIVKNSILRYINFKESHDSFGSFIEDLVDRGLIPLNYLPIDSDYIHFNFIENKFRSYEEMDYLIYKIINYKPKFYCVYDEELYIKLLGNDYRDCESVEEVLKVMHENNLTRDNMSLMEMFALKLYACKVLHQEKIFLDIKIFYIDSEMENGASYDKKQINLCINGKNNKIIDMIRSLNHEIIHSIQDKNIRDCNIAYDNDIDVYSKDEILHDLLGCYYYNSNYHKTFSEFDAEFKAKMITAQMFGLVKIKHDGKISTMKKNAFNMVEYVRKRVVKDGLYLDITRNYTSLNELFEKEMRHLMISNLEKYKDILKNYPIIKYEYKTIKTFKRKSIKELLDEINKSKDKNDIGIYYNLLKSRINDYKESGDDCYNAIETLDRFYKNNNYNEVTNKIIDHLVEIDIGKADYKNKYKGYFNKKGFNKQ